MLVNDLLCSKCGTRPMSADRPPAYPCTFKRTTIISWERITEGTAEKLILLQHQSSWDNGLSPRFILSSPGGQQQHHLSRSLLRVSIWQLVALSPACHHYESALRFCKWESTIEQQRSYRQILYPIEIATDFSLWRWCLRKAQYKGLQNC